MAAINITKADFLKKVADFEKDPEQWKYLGDKPALVEFYAPWCSHCKAFTSVLDELAHEYAGKIHIYKVDTEKEQELTTAFGINAIPTLLFAPMKGMPQMAEGAAPKKDVEEAIDRILLHAK